VEPAWHLCCCSAACHSKSTRFGAFVARLPAKAKHIILLLQESPLLDLMYCTSAPV
jgi:hypothetical protein